MFCGHILLVILTVKKLLEKDCKRQIKNSLELKKKSREKAIKYILNGKIVIIRLIIG